MKTIMMDLDDTLTIAGVSEYPGPPVREGVLARKPGVAVRTSAK